MSFINTMHSFIHTYALFFALKTRIKDKILGVSLVGETGKETRSQLPPSAKSRPEKRYGRTFSPPSIKRYIPAFDSPRKQSSLLSLPALLKHKIVRKKSGNFTLGAGRENRTPVLSLARTCHTTKLYPHNSIHSTIHPPKFLFYKNLGWQAVPAKIFGNYTIFCYLCSICTYKTRKSLVKTSDFHASAPGRIPLPLHIFNRRAI